MLRNHLEHTDIYQNHNRSITDKTAPTLLVSTFSKSTIKILEQFSFNTVLACSLLTLSNYSSSGYEKCFLLDFTAFYWFVMMKKQHGFKKENITNQKAFKLSIFSFLFTSSRNIRLLWMHIVLALMLLTLTRKVSFDMVH